MDQALRKILERVAKEEGVPLSYLVNVARVESAGGTLTRNPTNPDAAGAFQITGAARQDAGITQAQASDNLTAARTAANIYKTNSANFRRSGLPVTDSTMYLAHQQGLRGAKEIISTLENNVPLSSSRFNNIVGNLNSGERIGVIGTDDAPLSDRDVALQFVKAIDDKIKGKAFTPITDNEGFDALNKAFAIPEGEEGFVTGFEKGDIGFGLDFEPQLAGGPRKPRGRGQPQSFTFDVGYDEFERDDDFIGVDPLLGQPPGARRSMEAYSRPFDMRPPFSTEPRPQPQREPALPETTEAAIEQAFAVTPQTIRTERARAERNSAIFESDGLLDRMFGARRVQESRPEYRWVNVGRTSNDPFQTAARRGAFASDVQRQENLQSLRQTPLQQSEESLLDPFGGEVGRRPGPRTQPPFE